MKSAVLDTETTDLAGHEDNRVDGIISDIKETQRKISEAEEKLLFLKTKHEMLKRRNYESTVIKWKKSVYGCLEVDKGKARWFLKSISSTSKCIAKRYSIDINRDARNKIATTMSLMYKAGEIGRMTWEGITYYGLPEFFEADLNTLKKEYEKYRDDLTEIA